jgi:hypothetical protein
MMGNYTQETAPLPVWVWRVPLCFTACASWESDRRRQRRSLAEHWDVIEDEVTREKSASRLPMFGAAFPS